MFKLPSFSFLKRLNRKKGYTPPAEGLQVDEIEIVINGILMKVTRRLSLDVPHEITAVIPRVEIRHRKYDDGQIASEDETILNSITIVHAPRHPLAGETPPKAGPMPEEVSQESRLFGFRGSRRHSCSSETMQ